MGKQIICKGENKVAEQLCSNCIANQRLCFRCTDMVLHYPLPPAHRGEVEVEQDFFFFLTDSTFTSPLIMTMT